MKKNIISELRKKRKITQSNLSTFLNLTQGRIARIEENPDSVSFGQIKEILKFLGARIALVEEESWGNPFLTEKSFVYVLHHKDLPLIKVGKANNIEFRAMQIGDIDMTKSLSIESDTLNVFRLEKVLHKTFNKWSLTPNEICEMGISDDGCTEWFKEDCKERLMDFVKSNEDLLGCSVTELNKGCPFCGSQVDTWYGLGLPVYACESKENSDGSISKGNNCNI